MGAINTITDLQKVFGDKPLSSIQPVLLPQAKMPNGKKILIAGGTILSLIGLYTIFSIVKDKKDGKSSKNSTLEEMKKFRKSEMEKWNKDQENKEA